MPSLCQNVIYDAYENQEAAARSVFPYLDRAPNDAIQITTGARVEQGHDFALTLKSRYPKMDVVFRKMPDDNQHEHFPDPRAWFDSFAPWAAGGKLILSNTNEPGTGNIAVQNDWMAGTLELCGRAGIRCATWSLQTHNQFLPAGIDATLRMCAKYQHPFAAHYYFSEGFPVDPIHKTVAAYCKQKGIGKFPIFITELGYARNLDPYAGYQKSPGYPSEAYADALTNIAEFYGDLKFFIYCWGNSSPWGWFDISQDTVVQNAIVEYNKKGNPVPVIVFPPETGGVEAKLTKIPSSFINVRDQPLVGNDVGDLLVGDVVTYFAPQLGWGGWAYVIPVSESSVRVAVRNAASGWVALQGGAVVFTPTGTDVPPTLTITEQQLALLKEHNAAIQMHSEAIAVIVKEVGLSGNGDGF